MIVFDGLTEDEAFNKERELIQLYKSRGYCEANMTEGGEGLSNPPEEVRLKLSKSKSGKKNPATRPEVRAKISQTLKGHVQSEETKLKRANANRGKKRSPEFREALRLRMIGNKRGVKHEKG